LHFKGCSALAGHSFFIHKNFVAGFDTPRDVRASAFAADSDIPPAIPRRSAAGKFIPQAIYLAK